MTCFISGTLIIQFTEKRWGLPAVEFCVSPFSQQHLSASRLWTLFFDNWIDLSSKLWRFPLTLKLAGYFAKHIQAGGRVRWTPPRILKQLIISTCPLACNLVHDLLINLHSNNHHLISHCCHGNKTKNPRWPPMAAILDFRFLKFCLILRDFVGNS